MKRALMGRRVGGRVDARRVWRVITAVGLAVVATPSLLFAQAQRAIAPFQGLTAAPMASTFLKLPDDIHLGEVAGVARNSRGEIFVYTRTSNPTITLGTSRAVSHGGSRLLAFDANGAYTREFGQGIYGFLEASQLRVDPQDNVWVVDVMSNLVIKFDPQGRLAMVLGRKPEAMNVPGAAPAGAAGGAAPGGGAAAPGAAAPGRAGGAAPAAGGGGGGGGGGAPSGGTPGETFNRPTDVAWDAQGNIYVADGLGGSRIAKYDREGRWIKGWGSRGSGPGQFNQVTGLAIDAQGNVYVADRGNGRIQVFDTEGTFKREIGGLARPSAICLSGGANPVLFVSNSNPPDDIDSLGDIVVMRPDGTRVGSFGRAGRPVGEFNAVNSIDCRNRAELLIGEIGSWRVQRVRLTLP